MDSASGHSDPLLGADSEPAVRWEQEGAARKRHRHTRRCAGLGWLFPVNCVLAVLVVAALYLLLQIPVQETATSVSSEDSSSKHADALTTPERDLKQVLHPQDHVSRQPTVLHFSWNITKATLAPDGARKEVYLINGQFPGPTIEARSGDTIVVEVFNSLEEPVSLHWHGLYMKGANDMDGPVGINQCPMPAGGKFIYEIPTDRQAGTFWYHAHSELQRSDGLFGGLVIHNPEIKEDSLYRYDEELLFMVGDWYHWTADRVLAKFKDYSSGGNEPCPDSLLINGLGYFQCSMAMKSEPVDCSDIARPWLYLDKTKRYRVRVVNVGSLTGLTMTVPDATLHAIKIDGGRPVVAEPANSVGVLYPAQRVDFVMSWADETVASDSEFIIDMDDEYFLQLNLALTPRQVFRISSGLPETKSSKKKANNTEIVLDLKEIKGPLLPSPLPEPSRFYMIYAVVELLSRNKFIPQGFINHTTWLSQDKPLLALDRSEWDSHQLVPWTGNEPVWVELTINNIDTQGHPFHLHGFDFYVVGTHAGNGGWDYYNPFTPERPPRGGPFNVIDPVSRDTVYVPPYGYVVLRFLADNEGLWTLHCHILWHQATGMAMAFQVMGGENGLSQTDAGRNANKYCTEGKTH